MISFRQKLGWCLASLGVAIALPVAVLEYKKKASYSGNNQREAFVTNWFYRSVVRK